MKRTALAILLLATAGVGCSTRPATTTAEDGTAVTMDHNLFGTEAVDIPVGGRLTFANSSGRALHILVPGKDAQPKVEAGIPSFGGSSGHRAEVGDRWTTPAWNTPGTYFVTCTLHPSMNLKVTVA